MRDERLCWAAVVVIALTAGGCTSSAGNQPSSAPPPAVSAGFSYADLVERAAPHVVTVRTTNGIGSGVVFRSDVVLTNEHVVGSVKQVEIEYADGGRSPGTVLAADAITDLAVVRTDRKDLPVAEFRLELPRPGDPVMAIGSPLGFENSVTAGIVSGLHREIPGSVASTRSMVDLIQTDAPISPGNSGGALFDTAGRVVGINEAYIPPKAGAVSLGFAIPAATAVDVAEQLLADGTAEHPYLGVTAGRLTPQIREQYRVQADHGVLVFGVDQNGPGAAAGVRGGDVIVKMGESEVRSVEDLLGALRGTEDGQRVQLTLMRDGQRQEVGVTIRTRER